MNENEKSLKEKVLNTTTAEQVYNPEKNQIINTLSPLLYLSCVMHNYQLEKWEKRSINFNHIVV